MNMKDLLLIALAAGLLDVALIFGIDAEVARRDREFGRNPDGCLFESNCWAPNPKRGNVLAEKIYASLQKR